jgi:2-enoate reductase
LKYPKLFEPITIGNVTVKNRIAMAPMGLVGLTTPEGHPTQRAMDYYIERAKGGVGLIITGLFKVENDIDACALDIARITPASRWVLSEFCDSVHAMGTKIFIQLTAGFGRVIRPTRVYKTPVSASPNPNYWNPGIACRELRTDEVASIAAAFGDAAEIIADIGFDGIELHGHEGYLLDQFTTAIWNQRSDKYGGDLKGRLTFPIEILDYIKKRAGKAFPVQYRFGIKHYIKGLNQAALAMEKFEEAGRDVEEGVAMAKLLEQAGFDALHVDAGCYDSWYWAHPPSYNSHGCMIDMAVMAKDNVRIPVTAVGRLEIPELAEKVIATGQADMVALGRGLLADAYWPHKVRTGQIDHIRPCVGCHGCFSRFEKGRPLSCVVNPSCGRERIYPILPATSVKKVLVVGGGMAGMEAARVAAKRGHDVSLCEKSDTLGGHIRSASIPGFKQDLKRLQFYYETQLKILGVHIMMEKEATIDWIGSQNPDVLMVAVGSRARIPDIPGVDKRHVCTCIDVLLGKRQAGSTPVIVGGGLVGCEVALWLAEKGADVTVVEMLPELMMKSPIVAHMNRVMLLDLLAYNRVSIMCSVQVEAINDDSVIVVDANGEKKDVPTDNVILAAGMTPLNEFYYEALKCNIPEVYNLGDCREVRNIAAAILDGHEVGRMI